MEKPEYVVKGQEAVVAYKVTNPGNTVVRYFVILLLGGMVAVSYFTDNNMFANMSEYYKLFLVFCFLWAILAGRFKKKGEMVPSDIELRFYPDKLELYREKRTYASGKTKKTLTRFLYTDISGITYDQASKRLIIQGQLEDINWVYKNGTCPAIATSQETIKDGFDVIDTSLDNEHDFVKEIREHTDLKVRVNREIDLGFKRAMGKK